MQYFIKKSEGIGKIPEKPNFTKFSSRLTVLSFGISTEKKKKNFFIIFLKNYEIHLFFCFEIRPAENDLFGMRTDRKFEKISGLLA